MARTQTEIKSLMTTAFMGNAVFAAIYTFTVGAVFGSTFSLVSVENMLFDIVSFAHFVHEQMFDQHKKEVDTALANQKLGTLPWYRTMALRFQYGFDLVNDRDYFDNGTATNEQIEASKIVKYAAVTEASESSRVIIKIAGENESGNLSPIEADQQESFQAYVNEIKVAGVQCTIINFLPDRLYLTIQIKRDALVLGNSGMSILNGNFPVNDAIEQFLKELPFNGELRLSALVDGLQMVPGVLDATVMLAMSAWIDPETNGYGAPVQFPISTIPFSGYFEIVTFDNIGYVV